MYTIKNNLSQKSHLLPLMLALLTALAIGLLWPNLALAGGPITTTTIIDEFNTGPDCSVREAIQSANTDSNFGGCTRGGTVTPPYTIIVPTGIYTLTITGAGENNNNTGDLDIVATMTISGAGAGNTIINGNTSDRVFHIFSTGAVTLSRLSVVSGTTGGYGGGAYVAPGGALTVLTSTFSGNTAVDGSNGGGILNFGSVYMRNTTVSNNSAREGGGINNNTAGIAYIRYSTINNN
ncbi:MAG: hypothetical protein GY869_15140, partial [Planctomycetes bacterium]|nr:hypothetical protein [Planctomycetota bacterium]